MTNLNPIISNYIKPCSLSISPKSSAKGAFWLMRKTGVQYLPVKRGKEIVGLLPANRVRAALSAHAKHTPKVAELMLEHPAVCAPDASLYSVLDETPENVGGCTVVQKESGEVTGVFTPSDAVFAFRSLIGKRRHATTF